MIGGNAGNGTLLLTIFVQTVNRATASLEPCLATAGNKKPRIYRGLALDIGKPGLAAPCAVAHFAQRGQLRGSFRQLG
jgi:hypothetical protein